MADRRGSWPSASGRLRPTSPARCRGCSRPTPPATRPGRRSSRAAEAAIAAAIDRLEADGPLPVCFLGGLGPEFARRLAARYPGMIRPPRGTGLDGALAMARGLA